MHFFSNRGASRSALLGTYIRSKYVITSTVDTRTSQTTPKLDRAVKRPPSDWRSFPLPVSAASIGSRWSCFVLFPPVARKLFRRQQLHLFRSLGSIVCLEQAKRSGGSFGSSNPVKKLNTPQSPSGTDSRRRCPVKQFSPTERMDEHTTELAEVVCFCFVFHDDLIHLLFYFNKPCSWFRSERWGNIRPRG